MLARETFESMGFQNTGALMHVGTAVQLCTLPLPRGYTDCSTAVYTRLLQSTAVATGLHAAVYMYT
jgi:hypothetical protein